jgi:bifunctional DNase/RNase
MKEEFTLDNGPLIRIEEYNVCATHLDSIAIKLYTAKREQHIVAPFSMHDALPLIEVIWHFDKIEDYTPTMKLMDELRSHQYTLLEDLEKLFHFNWHSLIISDMKDNGQFLAYLCTIDADGELLDMLRIELHDGMALMLKNKLPIYVCEGVFNQYEQYVKTRLRWFNLKEDFAWDVLRTMDAESLNTYTKDELATFMDAANEREEYEIAAKIYEVLKS